MAQHQAHPRSYPSVRRLLRGYRIMTNELTRPEKFCEYAQARERRKVPKRALLRLLRRRIVRPTLRLRKREPA
jgi:hypothetical protein